MTIIDELEKLYRIVLPEIKNDVRNPHGLMAQAFVIEAGGQFTVLAMPFRDEDEKRMTFAFVDKLCADRQARGLVYFSETWMAEVKLAKGEDFLAARRGLPDDLSEAPGRKEGILGLLLTHGWSRSYMTEIVRNARGDVVRFEPEKEGPAKMEQNMFRYFVRFAI